MSFAIERAAHQRCNLTRDQLLVLRDVLKTARGLPSCLGDRDPFRPPMDAAAVRYLQENVRCWLDSWIVGQLEVLLPVEERANV